MVCFSIPRAEQLDFAKESRTLLDYIQKIKRGEPVMAAAPMTSPGVSFCPAPLPSCSLSTLMAQRVHHQGRFSWHQVSMVHTEDTEDYLRHWGRRCLGQDGRVSVGKHVAKTAIVSSTGRCFLMHASLGFPCLSRCWRLQTQSAWSIFLWWWGAVWGSARRDPTEGLRWQSGELRGCSSFAAPTTQPHPTPYYTQISPQNERLQLQQSSPLF